MSDFRRFPDFASSDLPEPIAAVVREKDRIIRRQAKRIEQLEGEVLVLRSDRDQLNTKVSLLTARLHSSHLHHEARQGKSICTVFPEVEASPKYLAMNNTKETNSFSDVGMVSVPFTAGTSQVITKYITNNSAYGTSCENSIFAKHKTDTSSDISEHVHSAALVIQHAYRKYHMHKNFARLRSEAERSRRSGERNQDWSIRTFETNPGNERLLQPQDNNFDSGGLVAEGQYRLKPSSLRTISEHCSERLMVDKNTEQRLAPLYPEYSDSSDNDSILDAAVEPAYDVSSTNFENLVEAEEVDGVDDSFNSDESPDDSSNNDAMSSQCSTLRASDTCGLNRQWSLTYGLSDDQLLNDRSRIPLALRNLMSDSTYSDTDSVTDDTLTIPALCDAMEQESGNFDAFVRFRIPGSSPIWKRKSTRMGSTGSLPDESSFRLSQMSVTGSSDPSELGSSIADVSQSSESSGTDGAATMATNQHLFPTQSYSEFSSRYGLEAQSPSVLLSSSVFCSAGACVQSDRLRKRVYRIGLNLFNKKPERGIKYLIENRFIDFRPNAVARFLVSRKGLSRQMIGEYLGTIQKPFNVDVLRCFSEEIDLSGLQVDVALRKYQSYFRMPGEAQKIERLMEVFAHRYCACNPDQVKKFRTADTVFLLAFAIIMLNTDQHNKCIKEERRMTINDFINNLRGIDDGENIDQDLLVGIYERVRSCEFKPGSDHMTQVSRVEQMIVGKKPQLVVSHRRLVCYCRLYEVPDLSKHEKLGTHQRELFLFNDFVVVTKILSKKKKSMSYSFRQAFPLLGMAVYLFETPYYKFGVRLMQASNAKVLITLCARTEHDRTKFVEDLKEAILEVDEMELLESYENRKGFGHSNHGCLGSQQSREANRRSKDSGVVDVDHPRLSTYDCDERKNSISSSIFDFNERYRTGSHVSLDSGMVSAGSSSAGSCVEAMRPGHSQSLRLHQLPAPDSATILRNKTSR